MNTTTVRKQIIGGSDAAAILGMSRWQTPLGLWGLKTGLIEKEERDEEYLELGRELEDYIVRRFTKKSGKIVTSRNQRVTHPQYDFIGGEIDGGIVGEHAIFEAKTASGFKTKEWKDEEIPTEYLIQCQHYLACTGAERAYIAVLIGNYSFQWKVIERDEDFINTLIRREVEFWNDFVLPKNPPAVTFGDAQTLLEIFPEAKDQVAVKLGDDADNIMELLEGMKSDAKNLDKQIELKENELKAMLGDHEYGETSRYRIRWRSQSSKRLDTTRIKKELPDVASKFTKETKTRVFGFQKIEQEGQNGNDGKR